MNELLLLIRQTQEKDEAGNVITDEYGDPVAKESSRQVFCGIRSIGQKEFYQAHANGLKPEIKFVLADYLDYENEMLAEHNGQRYRVLRTYRTGKELEIVCYREVNPK